MNCAVCDELDFSALIWGCNPRPAAVKIKLNRTSFLRLGLRLFRDLIAEAGRFFVAFFGDRALELLV